MSTISNIHTAIVYESKGSNKSIAQFGQRGVVTIAKASRDPETKQLVYGQHLQQTMFTSIPQLTREDIDFSNSRVIDVCLDYLKSVQNSIIADNLKSGNKTITTEQLSQSAILSYLEAENSSDAWTAERISQWFNDNLAESLGVKLIEAGKSDSDLERILSATSKRFSDTFSSRAKISPLLCNELNKALTFATNKSDSAYTKFYNRLNPQIIEISLEDSLGF